MKTVIIYFLTLCIAISSSATELKGAALLNKVSLSLRGVPASAAEQKTIAAMQDAEQKIYLSQKIDDYQKSALYSEKMTLRLLELFQMRAATLSDSFAKSSQAQYIGASEQYAKNNAATNLFSELTEKNLSWDTLLTGKEYSISAAGANNFPEIVTDYGFYGKLAGLPAVGAGDVIDTEYLVDINELVNRRITFSSDDLRIAGALTTGKFFARYATTGVNKNRRRAAAIFRIFLCDRMTAAIPQMSGIDETTYALLFPNQNSPDMKMTESEIKAILNKDDSIHGSKADCRSCHYKLDPVGKVFNNSGAILGSKASAGALIYKNSAGQIVNKPVAGIAELAQKISEEPDYVSCQVQHFWNWYIGEDKVLNLSKRQELMSAFIQSGRKTNDFVKKMVLLSDFAQREEPNELKDIARKTKKFLVQCQSCHQNLDSYEGEDLGVWPLKNPDYWVKNIAKVLDLDNMGKNRTMPPAIEKGGYTPTKNELIMIRKWIDLGAPDESGKLQIAPKEVKP